MVSDAIAAVVAAHTSESPPGDDLCAAVPTALGDCSDADNAAAADVNEAPADAHGACAELASGVVHSMVSDAIAAVVAAHTSESPPGDDLTAGAALAAIGDSSDAGAGAIACGHAAAVRASVSMLMWHASVGCPLGSAVVPAHSVRVVLGAAPEQIPPGTLSSLHAAPTCIACATTLNIIAVFATCWAGGQRTVVSCRLLVRECIIYQQCLIVAALLQAVPQEGSLLGDDIPPSVSLTDADIDADTDVGAVCASFSRHGSAAPNEDIVHATVSAAISAVVAAHAPPSGATVPAAPCDSAGGPPCSPESAPSLPASDVCRAAPEPTMQHEEEQSEAARPVGPPCESAVRTLPCGPVCFSRPRCFCDVVISHATACPSAPHGCPPLALAHAPRATAPGAASCCSSGDAFTASAS